MRERYRTAAGTCWHRKTLTNYRDFLWRSIFALESDAPSEPVAALSLNVIFFLVDTLRDWIYSVPTWLSGSIIVFGAVALALLALICFHQFVPSELRRAHNDVAGFIIAIVGVISELRIPRGGI